jgi:aspartate ammonia-lyase
MLASQAGQLELNVMMPIIAHNLFEMMQVAIGSIQAFTQFCVVGVKANRQKAEGWLAKNAIVVTALNPLIGYSAGAALVKEALQRDLTVQAIAVEKAKRGELHRRDNGAPVTVAEIESAFGDLYKLTEGGIFGGGGG